MSFIFVLNIVSMLVWFFPLIKQRKTEYFLFFMLISLGDPLALASHYTVQINQTVLYMGIFALQIALLNKGIGRLIAAVSGITITVLISLTIHSREIRYFFGSAYIFVVILFLLWKFYFFLSENKINVFLTALILYYCINFFRFLAMALSYEQGAISFYTGYIIQMTFALFFTFINVDTKNIMLNKKEQPV